MSDPSNQTERFATLFESITGQATITEQQRSDIKVRFDEYGTESKVADYIDAAAIADGFEDVIDEPETH